jgi:carbon-monoxide dehydrogenase small subunit
MAKVELAIKINGKLFNVAVEPSMLLLDLLRDELGLTGAKRGCETGYCGCCSVLIDGKAIHSCSMLAVRAQQHEVLTIEGMEQDGKLHPIQEAFLERNAAQCGYCTPGMIISARALLAENPSPDESQIKRALSGNLCRCTGYLPIIDAVLHASRKAQ